ncbi:sensor histidine kinase [Streptosporangium pseudovulgare]|nr:histidine kinase [Streptosporangium pseudovulgare]
MRDRGLFAAAAWPVRSVGGRGGRWTAARGVAVLVLAAAWPVWWAVAEAVRPDAGPARAAAAALAVCYAAGWVAGVALGTGWPPRARIALLCGLFALGGGLILLQDDPMTGLDRLVYVLAAAVWLLPARWGVLLGLVAAAGRLAVAWTVTGSVNAAAGIAVIPGTVTPVAVMLLIRLLVQLSQARDEIETLATAAERARLARDLHDVLGHTLTTITAKTGLTRRLLESGADRDRAVAELRDIERLSREAHAEVRATVSGRRRPSLAVELAGARAALRAAGIRATLPHAVDHVSPELREPFAYVLREGVTNVVRHSGAARCEVRLGESSLEIRDDGRSPARAHEAGNGLAGLAERLRAVGGRLDAGPLPEGGFRLLAGRS